MSPDLSWIENVWTWADRQLKTKHPNIQTIPELKSAITTIFKHVPKQMLGNYVRGMRTRLRKVVYAKGSNIKV